MSQAGYTPIQLYYSTTAAAAPSAGNLANGELAVNITDGKLFYKDNGGVVRVLATAAGSAGDVVGPGSSTDNALVRFDGTTGKLVQSSVGILSDAGALSGLTSVAATTFTGALTGNASTATTLQTSRTIWGQSFDGSANVTGALTGVTDLTASGSLTLNGGTANGVPYLNGSKVLTTGSALTFDGGGNFASTGAAGAAGGELALKLVDSTSGRLIQMLRTGATFSYAGVGGAEAALYTASNNLNLVADGGAIKFNVGTLGSATEQMRLTSTGLGIGTSSPTDKLHVVGLARINTGTYAAGYGLTFQANSETSRTYQMGMVTGGNFAIYDSSAATTRLTLDTSGNLGLGVTPSAWASPVKVVELPGGSVQTYSDNQIAINQNFYYNTSDQFIYKTSAAATQYQQIAGAHKWFTAPSGTAGNAISFTQAMTLDASGNLLVGGTTRFSTERVSINQTVAGAQALYTKNLSGDFNFNCWNAATSGDNQFIQFITEASPTSRGSITYNRGAGLVAYNVTSDYRAKDIIGPVVDSGALIDSVPVYMGKMKGATQERPMFIAHEVPAYAHTGVKDAVDADGNPVYQQMDASALVPVMWAEIQSLRKRLAAAGI